MAAVLANIVLKVTGPEATMLCQNDQLRAGLKVRIDGAIHGVQALWDKNWSTEEWFFFLIDTNIAFNEINRVGVLWTVQNLWLSIARFVFNCYRHWSSIVFLNGNGTDSILHSREGMTQGDTLVMIPYGIWILPLIKNIKQAIPDVIQPWYADDAGDLGTFGRLETYFDSLTRQGQTVQERTDHMPGESRGWKSVRSMSRI